jgi:hypothetical protein
MWDENTHRIIMNGAAVLAIFVPPITIFWTQPTKKTIFLSVLCVWLSTLALDWEVNGIGGLDPGEGGPDYTFPQHLQQLVHSWILMGGFAYVLLILGLRTVFKNLWKARK